MGILSPLEDAVEIDASSREPKAYQEAQNLFAQMLTPCTTPREETAKCKVAGERKTTKAKRSLTPWGKKRSQRQSSKEEVARGEDAPVMPSAQQTSQSAELHEAQQLLERMLTPPTTPRNAAPRTPRSATPLAKRGGDILPEGFGMGATPPKLEMPAPRLEPIKSMPWLAPPPTPARV